MNGKISLVVRAAIVEMVLVALGLTLWKWRVAGLETLDHDHRRRLMAQAMMLLAYPLWLVAGWSLARRRLALPRQAPSAEHVRWFETGLLVAALMLVAVQGWTARNFVLDETLGRLAMLRAATVFIGVLTAVQGNFLAKVDPPNGDRAPEAAAWSRTMLRIGWGMAAIGLLVVACAVALPPRLLLPVMLVAVAALMINSLIQRRGLKPAAGGR